MTHPTYTLTQRHYWADTAELQSEHHAEGRPGTAEESRQVRIRRLRHQGKPFTTAGGVVSYLDHYAFGEDSFDVRVELDWTDDAQPHLLSTTTEGE